MIIIIIVVFSLSRRRLVTVYDGMGCNYQCQVMVRNWVYRGSSYAVLCYNCHSEDPQFSETYCSLVLVCSAGLVMELW